MPRKPKKERVSGQYFTWLLGTRDNGVYYADGRGNRHNVGRHSLATRDHQEALAQLRRLDLVKATQFGLADSSALRADQAELLMLEEGQQRYLAFVSRPAVQGGGSAGTVKRYRAVLDKFVPYAKEQGICFWQQVSKDLLRRYGSWLETNDYHDKTQYIELTVLKQVIKWMVAEKLLPATSLISLKLQKPAGTNTYCYSHAEVQAIVHYCREEPPLHWLADVVIALATTGLRIGELASLRWSDVDLEREVLRLMDTTRKTRRSKRQQARATKSHRDRTLPIHDDFKPILAQMPHEADNFIFHGPRGGRLKPDTVRNVLKREVLPALAEKFPARGDDPGIAAGRLHSFRHYFCSMSSDHDVPEQLLMAWLGHRDSEMIRHYYHLRQDEARRQMAKIPFLGKRADESVRGVDERRQRE
ncbi:MAG TPA: site-specific integrase [Gemmataceae bacterium]|nr:site-specific integrase [Gemmataceae bacterium]